MRLHRFFVSQPVNPNQQYTVESEELANQIRRVFRLKIGDEVILFDGSGSDYRAKIVDGLSKASPRFDIIEVSRSRFTSSKPVVLCAAVVKKDTFEWIVEKATELGVTDIVPIIAERSEKKSLNEVRLKKIALEASEQSGRGDVPVIHGLISLKQWITGGKAVDNYRYHQENGQFATEKPCVLAFHTEGQAFEHSKIPEHRPLVICIGPEGGWSSDELELFHVHDIPVVCLGPQVLRAETAVIAALSQVVFGN